MARASLLKEDMYVPSSRGFIETIGSKKLGRIVAVVARYLQWNANKATGAQASPVTSVILSIAHIDESGAQVEEPVEQELVAEWTPQDGSLIRIRPGIAEGPDDDPQDTAENGQLVLGTEGNTLFTEEGAKYNMKQPFPSFAVDCVAKGFKPEIMGRSYLQDLVGIEAWFDLRPLASGKKKSDGSPVTEFYVDKFTKYPYEKAKAAAASAPKSNAAAKGKANGAAKAPATAPAAATAAPAASGDLDEICLNALRATSTEHAASANSSTILTRQKIYTTAMTKILSPKSGVAPTLHKPAVDMLKNKVWFEENAGSFGAVNSGDDAYMLIGMEG